MRVVTLTSLGGTALHPYLSPNGEQIVFSFDDLKDHYGTGDRITSIST